MMENRMPRSVQMTARRSRSSKISTELPWERAQRLGLPAVFFSLRFAGPGDAQQEADLIRRKLEAMNIVVMPAEDPSRVADRQREIFNSIKICQAFVVFANPHYGEDTGNPMCSYNECKYASKQQCTFAVINLTGAVPLAINESAVDSILDGMIWRPWSSGVDNIVEFITAKF